MKPARCVKAGDAVPEVVVEVVAAEGPVAVAAAEAVEEGVGTVEVVVAEAAAAVAITR
jgi:hypothetical protein